MSSPVAFLEINPETDTNPVKSALTCVQPIERSALKVLKNAKHELQDRKETLFGFEAEVEVKIDRFMAALVRRIKAIEELPLTYPKLAKKYSYFDVETALGWRNNTNGYPSLAIYGLTEGVCEFETYYVSTWNYGFKMNSPRLPERLKNCFNDINGRRVSKNPGMKLRRSSTFRGV